MRRPGFIAAGNKLQPSTEKLFAMRGPVSRAQVQASPRLHPRLGEVPRVYGDLGSLMAWYYQPRVQTRTYNICFIPHMSDGGMRTPFMRRAAEWPGVKVISIFSRLFDLMDQIVRRPLAASPPRRRDPPPPHSLPLLAHAACAHRCQFVFSSTMHGLIFSDSYDVRA